MKTRIKFYVMVFFLSTTIIPANSILHLADIGEFTTTNGSVIKDCKIGYRSIGKLNADSSNVILWPTWFTGTSEKIAEPDNITSWIDTAGYYIIMVDALANGVSSSPSNTNDFPEISVRDMVNSQYQLLAEFMNIKHIYAVIGYSMGGMQVFEWTIAYPNYFDKAISINGTPQPSTSDLYVWHTQLDLIKDSERDKKDIHSTMKRVYDIFFMQCYTPSFFTRTIKPENLKKWRNNSYKSIVNSKDFVAQMTALINWSIYKSSLTKIEKIFNVIKADMLIIVSSQDHIVNPGSSRELANAVGCKLVELDSDCGHISLWCESEKVKKNITEFLTAN